MSATALHQALGLSEAPYGVHYTDLEPEGGFAPDPGPALSLELEQQGKVDLRQVFQSFSCVLGKLWLARKKETAAYFEAARYGCPGGSFYLGFHAPQLESIACYISSGIPGTPMHGERYLPSPGSARRFFEAVDPRPAPKRFCVFKPLAAFGPGETPELVVFFGRGEVVTGLTNLAAFVTDDVEIVAAPFGAGCSFMVSWPLRYMALGRPRAVLGCGDPSARKYMKYDEMTFTVPFALYQGFLDKWQDSFLPTDTWKTVAKKIRKSKDVWGEKE